jgi:hypothetical protein
MKLSKRDARGKGVFNSQDASENGANNGTKPKFQMEYSFSNNRIYILQIITNGISKQLNNS